MAQPHYISPLRVIERRNLQPVGAKIMALCEYDRRLLPRRHPGTSNPADNSRHLAPGGAYSRIVVWRSRTHFLNVVVGMAVYARPHVLAKHGPISVDTFRRWAAAESQWADPSTGRRIIVRPDTVAAHMGAVKRTVQRCRAAARELGLLVDVAAGRMLTWTERLAARDQGSPQRGLANESAMTVPAWLGKTAWKEAQNVDTVTPPSGPPETYKRLSNSVYPRGATKPSRLTARQTTNPGGVRLANVTNQQATKQLAYGLIERIGFLYGEQPGRLVPTLARFAGGPTPWTAGDIATFIGRTDTAFGRSRLTRERVCTRPAIVLASYLRYADVQADHPRFDPDTGGLTPPARPWPAWCGTCEADTRQIELDDGRMARCPRCHPSATATVEGVLR